MPCYEPRSRECCPDDGRTNRLNAELARRVDSLTRMLCYLCGGTDPLVIAANRELADWWEQHQKDDAIRLERERAKLTRKL
jgi:hypothetical protein